MRAFFKSELETLKIKRGLNQWENLSSMTNAEGVNIGEQSIKMFLDLQEEVCEEFKYIPDNDKKRIIQYGILHEPDFMQWTPHHTWKWLNQKAGLYFKEVAHKPTESNAKPVTYEQLSPEVRAGVDAFLKALESDKTGLKPVSQVSQKEIDDLKIEDLEEREGKHSIKYPSTTKEDFELHQKRIAWAREFTDLQTGKIKEGSPSLEDYINDEKRKTI